MCSGQCWANCWAPCSVASAHMHVSFWNARVGPCSYSAIENRLERKSNVHALDTSATKVATRLKHASGHLVCKDMFSWRHPFTCDLFFIIQSVSDGGCRGGVNHQPYIYIYIYIYMHTHIKEHNHIYIYSCFKNTSDILYCSLALMWAAGITYIFDGSIVKLSMLDVFVCGGYIYTWDTQTKTIPSINCNTKYLLSNEEFTYIST